MNQNFRKQWATSNKPIFGSNVKTPTNIELDERLSRLEAIHQQETMEKAVYEMSADLQVAYAGLCVVYNQVTGQDPDFSNVLPLNELKKLSSAQQLKHVTELASFCANTIREVIPKITDGNTIETIIKDYILEQKQEAHTPTWRKTEVPAGVTV